MSEKIHGDEEITRLYIETKILPSELERKISYIDSRLQGYSFSPDFTNWLEKERSDAQRELEAQNNLTASTPTISNTPKQPDWPVIDYGVLNDVTEKKHLEEIEDKLIQKAEDNKERINEIPSELDDIAELRKTAAGYDEKRELTLQLIYLKDLQKELIEGNKRIAETENKPFFGRFDFKRNGEKEEVYYLTKTSLESHIDRHDTVNYIDWRAPIADVYYKNYSPTDDISFETAKHEIISGDLGLTARFDIENGKIKKIAYSTKSGASDVKDMSDAILQKTLSASSDDHMSEIVETIQPEQNDIIRQSPNKDIVIQGVAGSGKTAVALHRIAYLLYQNPLLRKGGIFFVSPNDTFSEYISNVLPELGEIKIPIRSYETFLNVKGVRKPESLSEFVERYYKGKTDGQAKSLFTSSFEKRFYQTCRAIEAAGQFRAKYIDLTEQIEAIDREKADLTSSKERLKAEIANKKRDAAQKRKQIIRFDKDYRDTPFKEKEQRKLKKKILDDAIKSLSSIVAEQKATEENVRTINDLLAESRKQRPEIAKKQAYLKKKLSEKEETFVFVKRANGDEDLQLRSTALDYYKQLCKDDDLVSKQYENVVYLTILNLLVDMANGKKNGDNSIRHIVVDEAQDYTEPFIYYLKLMYPKATFSILGDINQNINPYHKHRSLQALLSDASYFEMNKAYRSSPEIVRFCNAIIGANNVHPARDSQGEEVDTLSSSDLENDLKAAIDSYKEAGYSRIGIITKESKTAKKISGFIEEEGVLVYPIYTAKGLEFDACIVIDEFDKKEKELYYVACSRAQHKLTVIKPVIKKTKAKTASKKSPKKKTSAPKKAPKETESVEEIIEEGIPVLKRHKIDRGIPVLKMHKQKGIFKNRG